jgi:hypothetical protein
MIAVGVLALLPVMGAPALATAGSATLYELTENMGLDDLAAPTVRTASAALQGTAQTGTPICPAALMAILQSVGLPSGSSCTITAFGEDEVDLTTGSGSFTGSFAVVVNVDNPVDSPELVVMTGTFEAGMQVLVDGSFNPLPLIQITVGTVTPTDVLGVPVAYLGFYFPGVTPEMFASASFGGVFRLPFALDKSGKKGKPRPGKDAFYLGDTGQLIKVGKGELSLGYPTVRVEIGF